MPERLARARARLAAIAEAERADPQIDRRYGTRWWIGEDVAPIAAVLLHGLTNAPPQYDGLAPMLAARGHHVIVPRMPYHGYRDRMTEAIAALRASDLEATALDAVAIGALCARRVVALGISAGATLAGWLASRVAIDTAVAVAPFCAFRALSAELSDLLGFALRRAPNAFLWWDPRRKAAQQPEHGYPRFSTRALGEALLISTGLVDACSRAHARRAVLVFNTHDPAVNNDFAYRRFAKMKAQGVQVERVDLNGLPPMHDIVEPAIPNSPTQLVYPKLIDIIEAGGSDRRSP